MRLDSCLSLFLLLVLAHYFFNFRDKKGKKSKGKKEKEPTSPVDASAMDDEFEPPPSVCINT